MRSGLCVRAQQHMYMKEEELAVNEEEEECAVEEEEEWAVKEEAEGKRRRRERRQPSAGAGGGCCMSSPPLPPRLRMKEEECACSVFVHYYSTDSRTDSPAAVVVRLDAGPQQRYRGAHSQTSLSMHVHARTGTYRNE
eukprot:GHVU01154695.1.p2 GENE.GHVU01154695.1~~GHVU01154695.1.p2  ORF type:complete len:138 (-),score=35.92 GHVU01154695.1:105-518(-)